MRDDIFRRYYETNFWNDPESVSGAGSSLKATETIRAVLPTMLSTMGITSMLDISCGDFWWMAHIEEIQNIEYIGGDIVPELIRQNRQRYVHPNWRFDVMDVTKNRLPQVDLIFCRDTLVHFRQHDIDAALKNFRASGSKWFVATTFPGANPNQDIQTGEWRPIDLSAIRYGLGPPGRSMLEGVTGEFSNKSLGLWRING